MNKIYRLVWNNVAGALVAASEFARSRGGAGPVRRSSVRGAVRSALCGPAAAFAGGLLLAGPGAASAADSFLDFTGGIGDWTTHGTVVVMDTTDEFEIGGNPFSLTPAAGHSMVKITPDGGPFDANSLLGLNASSIQDLLGNSVTNFGVLTKSFTFEVGTYSFAWAYAAEDYVPYNDGVLFSLVGEGTQSIFSLARNGSGGDDLSGPSPETLILGSYGSTPWQTATFSITTAGTYQIGFAAYNWNDTALNPNLFVSGVTGSFTGTPPEIVGGGGGATTIGTTGGNVSESVFDTSSPAYSEPELAFDGGTLQYTGDMETDKDATLAAGGGTIDSNGYEVTYSGVIAGDGDLTKTGDGTLALSTENTYTGKTIIEDGTLSLTGSGSIASSSGVVANGTFDISNVASEAEIQSLSGGGTVTLGSKTLELSNASETFAGVIEGTGAVAVSGGTQTLSGANTYTGETSIGSGATLALSGTGAIASSSGVVANGTLDISSVTSEAEIQSLSGNGSVNLGSKTLELTDAAGTLGGVIQGGGAVVVSGGTQTLSGTNTYTGATTINNGATLALSGAGSLASSASVTANGTLDISNVTFKAAIQSLSGNGSVTLGSKTLELSDAAGTFAGVIQGSGAVVVSGGTQTLSGASTYTGATTINHGATLALSGAGSLAASSAVAIDGTLDLSGASGDVSLKSIGGSGEIASGDGTLKLTAPASTFAGTISGSGSLEVTNGTLTLAGANTHTGGTTIGSGGVIAVASDSGLGDSAGSLTLNDGGTLRSTDSMSMERAVIVGNAGVLEASSETTLTVNGPISGPGALTKTGSGVLVLSGDNSAWGSEDDATLGGITVNGGSVEVAHANALGHGSIALNGGTSLSSAIDLDVANAFAVTGGSVIRTDSDATVRLSGRLESVGGDSCFVKDGAGTLVMAGVANINVGTCVQQGQLHANGILNSTVSVAEAGTLRGTGQVTGSITVNGTLAPGNSPGLLVVNGPVVMAEGGVYQQDINGTGTGNGPGNYSQLVIAGAESTFVATGATLVPNLVNITGEETYTPYVPDLGDTFRIITAEGGIVGRFAELVQPEGLAPATRLAVFYGVDGSNSIDLRVLPTSYREYVTVNGANYNARSTAGALDEILAESLEGTSANNDAFEYAIAGLNGAQLRSTVTALSGEVHGAMAAVAPLADQWLQASVARQLRAGEGGSGSALWADVAHNSSDWQADAIASAFDFDRTQVALGFDLLRGGSLRLGVGFSHADSDISAAAGTGSLVENLGFLYGQYAFQRLVVEAMAGHGSSSWETGRADPIGFTSKLGSDEDGRSSLASAGLRWSWNAAWMNLEPYARLMWQRYSRDGFLESGASPSALAVARHSVSGMRATAGIAGASADAAIAGRFAYQFDLGVALDDADLVRPALQAALAGESISIRSPEVGRAALIGNVMLTADIFDRGFVFLGVSGQARSGTSNDIGANVGVRLAF